MEEEDNNKSKNPIEDLSEWQRNQYNPGYYTGGMMPPHATSLSPKRKKRVLAMFLLAIAVGSISVSVDAVKSLPEISMSLIFSIAMWAIFVMILFRIVKTK